MSRSPGYEIRRSLSVSGFAASRLFSASALARFPTRLIYRRARCIDTPRKSGDGSRGTGFWPLALLWLPAGFAAQAAARFLAVTDGPPEPAMWAATVLMGVSSLVVVAPCGLPLALGCRRLWRLGAMTVAASVFAGLLGPVAIAVCAVIFSLPAWGAWWWLAHNG